MTNTQRAARRQGFVSMNRLKVTLSHCSAAAAERNTARRCCCRAKVEAVTPVQGNQEGYCSAAGGLLLEEDTVVTGLRQPASAS